MCGIFGIIHDKNTNLTVNNCKKIIDKLFRLSESRGKDSSGIVIRNYTEKKIEVLKRDIIASKFIKTKEYGTFFNRLAKKTYNNEIKTPNAIFAHSRLVTNGSQENNGNNQPVIKSNAIAVHNGIITNVEYLWEKYSHIFQRKFDVDTEILLDIVTDKIENGFSFESAIANVFKEIEGAASLAIQFSDSNKVIIATNTGSLYYIFNNNNNTLIFASERYILAELLRKIPIEGFEIDNIKWLNPFTGVSINIEDFKINNFSFKDLLDQKNVASENIDFEIVNHHSNNNEIKSNDFFKKIDKNLFQYNIDSIKLLKRCTKCILPETFPFIEFDSKGVCNYCNNYTHVEAESNINEFKNILTKQKKLLPNGPNVIAPLSGGRDSVYGLHLLVNEFGMKPITFTYDWGMVTDLARRNIARVTGKLGVENIVVSADIRKKRKYIQQNIKAWIKKPDLGIIPLFMAGDKYFFRIVNKIKRDTGINIDIWSSNKFENTDFKVGYCGVKPNFNKERIDGLNLWDKFKLPKYYLLNYFLNPSYINSSIFDTIGAFYSYYLEPRNGYHLIFDYVNWDETIIEKTITSEYNFERSEDTSSLWRIGDGTASFYNYIYYTVGGFSEFETFRSNQIRAGVIGRNEALEKIYNENIPRIDSILWYCNTIGVEYEEVIKAINNIPKSYKI